MDELVVAGLVMLLVEIVKLGAKKFMPEDTVMRIVVPLSVFILGGVVNYGFAAVFTPDVPWRESVQAGLLLGAAAAGFYSTGKAALGKS